MLAYYKYFTQHLTEKQKILDKIQKNALLIFYSKMDYNIKKCWLGIERVLTGTVYY